MKGRVTGRDTERSSISWFTPQMVKIAGAKYKNQELAPRTRTWVAGVNGLESSSRCSNVELGGKAEQPGLEPVSWQRTLALGAEA